MTMDLDRVVPTLIIACFVCFAGGYLVGATGHETPRSEVIPANYDPSAPQLKACYQLLTTEIMGLKQQVAATCLKPSDQTAH